MENLYYKYIFCGLILFGYVSIAKGAMPVTKSETITDITTEAPEEYDDGITDENENSLPTEKYEPSTAQLLNKFHKQHFKIGTDVHLKCPVKNFGTPNGLLWYKNESLLATNINLINVKCCKLDFNKQTLILLNANKNDSGTYKCQILPEKFNHTIELVWNSMGDSSSGKLTSMKFELILITFSLLVFLRIFINH